MHSSPVSAASTMAHRPRPLCRVFRLPSHRLRESQVSDAIYTAKAHMGDRFGDAARAGDPTGLEAPPTSAAAGDDRGPTMLALPDTETSAPAPPGVAVPPRRTATPLPSAASPAEQEQLAAANAAGWKLLDRHRLDP